jgi:glutamate-1-semialdehyde 2,1-aminomutase
MLVQAGSGATTLGTPSSPGVPESVTASTVLVPYNDLPATRRAFDEQGNRIAAMIVEPIAGNMGCVPPAEGYLDGLRSICDEHGALLIFDEVMSGFRVAYGGAQDLYGVRPDLTCLGKVVGGGLPCAAYGGREKFMRMIAPDGPVYQAGTLSGNPLAMAAGIAQLSVLRDGDAYAKLGETTRAIVEGIESHAFKHGVPVQCSRVGSMATIFFSEVPVTNYEQACKCDTNMFAMFFGEMLDRGVVLPPSQFETWFVSTAHDVDCVQKTIDAAGEAFNAIAASRTV